MISEGMTELSENERVLVLGEALLAWLRWGSGPSDNR